MNELEADCINFGSEKKKVKFDDISISQLPNELLWMIFQACPAQYYPEMMLVCVRWWKVIEKNHVFRASNLFSKARTEDEYELALESNRKVELLIIVALPNYNQQLNYIKKTLIKGDNVIAKACLLLKNDTNSFTMDLLIDYLKCIRNLETVYLNFHRLFFYIRDIPPIEFKNLTFLSITDDSHQIVRKCLLSFKTPQLKRFKINSNYHQHSECEYIFNFINRNSTKIENVDVNMNFCNLKWSPESLELRPCRESKEELILFLNNRISTLRRLCIIMTYEDPTLYNFIYKDAQKLESFYISFNFIINVGLTECHSMHNVKELQLEFFQFNEENILALNRIFPNIELLYVRFPRPGKLSPNLKKLIRNSFNKLKEAKEFDSGFQVASF